MSDSRFLESIDNLKPLIKIRTGRTPKTEVCRQISSCLQQGRLFYAAAAESPLEIKPLQLFYGMLGFAKALVLGRSLHGLETLPQTHGIRDVSAGNARISDLRVKIEGDGTFQRFNDVCAPLTRIPYFEGTSTPAIRYVPSMKAVNLHGLELSLKDILGRIPTLNDLFRETFNELPCCEYFQFQNNNDRWTLEVFDRELFRDRESLGKLVAAWRSRFPFLKQWRFDEASHHWGRSYVKFDNFAIEPAGRDEFGEEFLNASANGFTAKLTQKAVNDPMRVLLSLAGGWGNPTYAIVPVQGKDVSEFSLHFLGMFLLSSLVRYRPHTWVNALSRSIIEGHPADDTVLALIEKFLDLNALDIPSFVIKAMNPHLDEFDKGLIPI